MEQRVLSQQDIVRLVDAVRKQGKSIGFTNGCFDILHVGHVRYLCAAKSMVDVLIVGVNSDESVRALKGPQRPVIPDIFRAEVLSALRCVDYVTIFSDRTAERIVEAIRPDIYFKGGDYTPDVNSLPESAIVREYGGKVVILPYQEGFSTTRILGTIRELLER
ncbi:D-glycero-beta-D-manno-heptose 1-phosphate adenylyltransferase [Thermobaculum terrenum]|uniref:D-glycero-beta-D-manno-heptose 1-phosphate adenylyltransferase n=1 Tax=Thermobaculum terrenum TaxID=166501 RepID=UPI00019BF28B|nr:D-glycero-beta-D-manno-heptose 1-phosphate adenylyltransferase [Thermobaculum terrenum]